MLLTAICMLARVLGGRPEETLNIWCMMGVRNIWVVGVVRILGVIGFRRGKE